MSEGIFRSIFWFLDVIVYKLISIVYQLFYDIASFDFNIGNIEGFDSNDFFNRIYAIIGIYLLFRISLILINFLADPSKFTNNEIGGFKLISNVLFALGGIVLLPFIFDLMFELQSIIIEEQVIENLFIGSSATETNSSSTDTKKKKANKFVVTLYSAFITENPNSSTVDSNLKSDLIKACDTSECNGIKNTFNELYIQKEYGGIYTYDYMFLISTLCGIAVLFILFFTCFDLAIRLVNLIIYQLLAPIALVSKIHPKDVKLYDFWQKELISAYSLLFIRLILMILIVFLMTTVALPLISVTSEGQNIWVGLLLVFGLLGSMLVLPKKLTTALGIKSTGILGFASQTVATVAKGAAISAGGLSAVKQTGSFMASKGKNVFNKAMKNNAEIVGNEDRMKKYNDRITTEKQNQAYLSTHGFRNVLSASSTASKARSWQSMNSAASAASNITKQNTKNLKDSQWNAKLDRKMNDRLDKKESIGFKTALEENERIIKNNAAVINNDKNNLNNINNAASAINGNVGNNMINLNNQLNGINDRIQSAVNNKAQAQMQIPLLSSQISSTTNDLASAKATLDSDIKSGNDTTASHEEVLKKESMLRQLTAQLEAVNATVNSSQGQQNQLNVEKTKVITEINKQYSDLAMAIDQISANSHNDVSTNLNTLKTNINTANSTGDPIAISSAIANINSIVQSERQSLTIEIQSLINANKAISNRPIEVTTINNCTVLSKDVANARSEGLTGTSQTINSNSSINNQRNTFNKKG
ncbi:MAG: hypothetical protein ACK5NF_06940 [Bacilli bacterium]